MVKVNINEHQFSSMEDFTKWKEEVEKETRSLFVQHSSNLTYGANKYWYLYCNRSGQVRLRGQGKRQLKTQGSSKTGTTCVCHMRIQQDTVTGKMIVKYCSSHTTHNPQLAHLPIPSNVKHTIATKLQEGVQIEKILDDVRDSIKNGELGREQLLTRQDILNIKKKLNIGCVTKHSNDLLSTCAWVDELKLAQYNPVLRFKPQGLEQPTDVNDLAKDDFLLVLQSEFQKDAMIRYGNKVVLMDATHGTTQYDFQLISILVIDDHGEGLPVAWAISNREDRAVLVQFLKSIHEKVGDLKPQYFMSDCADQYFNAWCGVFGRNDTRKLLCTWHIDRAWRKALNEHISDKQERIEVYHKLCVLLQERDEGKFLVDLQKLMSYLNEEYEDFYAYFNMQYVPRVKQWATCYRIGTLVNTNMFVESFHRVLKVVYLNNKHNRRVDHLVHILLRLARNLVYEHLKKMEIGKITHRKSEINKRHKAAKNMKKIPPIRSIGQNQWKIESFTNNSYYHVEKNVSDNNCSCPLRCSICNICVHMFSCTCLDASLHCTICKHVHFLLISHGNNILHEKSTDNDDIQNNEYEAERSDMAEDNFQDYNGDKGNIDEPMDTHDYFIHILQANKETELGRAKLHVKELAQSLISQTALHVQ